MGGGGGAGWRGGELVLRERKVGEGRREGKEGQEAREGAKGGGRVDAKGGRAARTPMMPPASRTASLLAAEFWHRLRIAPTTLGIAFHAAPVSSSCTSSLQLLALGVTSLQKGCKYLPVTM